MIKKCSQWSMKSSNTKQKKRAYLSAPQPHVRVHCSSHTYTHAHKVITHVLPRSHTHRVRRTERREPIIVLITPPTQILSSVWIETCRSSTLSHTHTLSHSVWIKIMQYQQSSLLQHPSTPGIQHTHTHTDAYTHPQSYMLIAHKDSLSESGWSCDVCDACVWEHVVSLHCLLLISYLCTVCTLMPDFICACVYVFLHTVMMFCAHVSISSGVCVRVCFS